MLKFGSAFSEGVTTYKIRKNGKSVTTQFAGWGLRLTVLYLFLIISCFLLAIRIFHLTIIEGKNYQALAEGNRVRTAVMHAARGILWDRNNTALTENIPGWRITQINCEKDCGQKFISKEEAKEQKLYPQEYFLEKAYARKLKFPFEFSHILGYLGEINQEELTNPYYSFSEYKPGDKIGRTGLEAVFEKELRGIDGKELIEISADGSRVRILGTIEEKPGKDFYLTIDSNLQRTAYEALGEKTGAVIVIKPDTYEILALVSTPGFDANLFNHKMSQSEYEKLINDINKPLFNRVISGVYPPGSIFKLISSTAGLESEKITKSTLIEDSGILRINEFQFANWYFTQYGKTEGMVDIVKAIARSNDIFFYKLGERTGVETISNWGKRFGIGKKTGLELLSEAEGVMPDPLWRKNTRGEEWYLGDTYHISIGQGDLQTTPLQVGLWANVIASRGKLCRPSLIRGQKTEDERENCDDLKISEETLNIITTGMIRACSNNGEYQGTGWPFFDFTVTQENLGENSGTQKKYLTPVACKTGTAEFGDAENKTHAWFTVFAPLPAEALAKAGISISNGTITGKPEISVTVLVEKGGEGSSVAGPIAKKILEEWFRR